MVRATTTTKRRPAADPAPDVEPAQSPIDEQPVIDELPDDPDPDRYRHTEVAGVRVVVDQPMMSSLIKGSTGKRVPMRGTRVLTLADGRRSYACRDCNFVGAMTMTDKDRTAVIGTRGEVRKHRYDKHGVKGATNRGHRRGDGAPEQEDLPLGMDPAAASTPLDPNVLTMELGEVLELAGEVVQWERTYGVVLADRDDWKARALTAERELRQIRRTLGRLLPVAEPGNQAGEGD